MSFSEVAAPPRDALAVTTDLHVLLQRAAVGPPYVLVGSSLGGLYTLLYPERYRQEVAGLVLVDPSELHDSDFLPGAPSVSAYLTVYARQIAQCLATVQQHPLMPGSGDYESCVPDAKDIESECKADQARCALAKAAHRAGLDFFTDYIGEQKSWGASTSEEVQSSEKSLGSLPLTVLTGGRTFANDTDVPDEEKVVAEKLWMQMHDTLAALSSRGRNVLVGDSGHVIQFDDPAAITSATESILDQAKSR